MLIHNHEQIDNVKSRKKNAVSNDLFIEEEDPPIPLCDVVTFV